MSANDFIARAYEQACADAMRAVEIMPRMEMVPLTRKQIIKHTIRYRKRQLGKLIYKISNKLGYYDDEYY